MKNNTNFKGANMLPFIAGIAAGALAVVAWSKKDELKDLATNSLNRGKELALSGLDELKGTRKRRTRKSEPKEAVVAKKPRKKRAVKKVVTPEIEG
ncbi:hypothetical protein [Campylobacter gastrosuis]|uniref:YtxH domain-containing protein n=1 Tax=Campylobacter gastrosuis TaxID=2974576 RepID=A0ABT7HN96_9BACT|nr:hypothetical protein [Campylobacter gastrosuis]MDL0088187.1 hypothetical protein [Campylobacter gastrosuis]